MAKITKDLAQSVENNELSSINSTDNNPTQMNELFQLVQKLQQQVKDLQWGWSEQVKKSKERYQWPLKASYWMRAWVPITSYKSVKKEEAFDWLYKDGDGKWIDNHYVEPTLVTEEKVKRVLRNAFETSVQKSDLMEFDIIDDRGNTIKNATAKDLQWRNVAYYVFNTEEYGEIKVLPTCIN